MILDTLENASRYVNMHKGFDKAFAFLMRPGLESLPADQYEIDGKNVFAIVAREQGRKREDALLETHEKYIDIQLVIAGTDTMGWSPKQACTHAVKEYDPDTDFVFYKDEPAAWVSVQAGKFVVFFPGDAHMPSLSSDHIHKIIVKIAVGA